MFILHYVSHFSFLPKFFFVHLTSLNRLIGLKAFAKCFWVVDGLAVFLDKSPFPDSRYLGESSPLPGYMSKALAACPVHSSYLFIIHYPSANT